MNDHLHPIFAAALAPFAPPKVSEGVASAQRINAAPLPVRCAHFPDCTYPEGECAELCEATRKPTVSTLKGPTL